MNINVNFTWKTAQLTADTLVFHTTGKHLSDLEIVILRGAWDNHTYEQIAEAKGYTSNYLSKDVGSKLWANLSTALKEKVSKKNFKAALQREWKNCTQANLFVDQTQVAKTTANKLAFPENLAELDSFYIERSPIESICYETIFKPGSLIRIKGAKWMGKTSLVKQILEQGKLQSQKTVYLDFAGVDRDMALNFNQLLRWLSMMVSHQLKLKDKFQQYWDENILVNNSNCTFYFEKYILAEIKSDLVLALDNIDRLFIDNGIFADFLRLLHSWHEKSQTHHHWSKLKLILTHSTKTPIPSDVDRSPLNAGVPILLEDFNYQQIKTLANLYQLDCDRVEIDRLINEIGGHPYLLRLAMCQMKAKKAALNHF